MEGDPRFRNAPIAFGVVDSRRLTDCTRETLYLRDGAGSFRAGETVEVDFDGVAREIVAAEGARLTIAPGLAEKPIKGCLISSWSESEDLALDLRLTERSPGARLSTDGGPIGSRIDISAYRRGDFDGDGVRDLPLLPPELELSGATPDS